MAKEKSYPHKIKKAAIIVLNRKIGLFIRMHFHCLSVIFFYFFSISFCISFWLVCLLPEKLVWFDVDVVFFFYMSVSASKVHIYSFARFTFIKSLA